MIYITGDTHGEFNRFGTKLFAEQKTMSKSDYVIICGDFGIWDDSNAERYWLDWLNDKPFTTLLVTGNHSKYDLLKTFPVQRWMGGNVQFIRDSIIHLMRGQLFELDGKRFFTMGGASSHDIDDGILEPDDPNFRVKRKRLDRRKALYRVNHISWWKEELPDDTEYATASEQLEQCGWAVDYIITHCAPTSVQNTLTKGSYQPDRLTDFFEEVKDRCAFRYCFFGHYHDNRVIDHFILLHDKIVCLQDFECSSADHE